MAFRQLTAPEKELRVLFVATVHPDTLESTDALAVLDKAEESVTPGKILLLLFLRFSQQRAGGSYITFRNVNQVNRPM